MFGRVPRAESQETVEPSRKSYFRPEMLPDGSGCSRWKRKGMVRSRYDQRSTETWYGPCKSGSRGPYKRGFCVYETRERRKFRYKFTTEQFFSRPQEKKNLDDRDS